MAYEQKENSGVLFDNRDRKKSEKQPDYRGTINLAGEEWELVGWIRTSKDGTKKFLSLKVSEPREKESWS